MLYKFTYNPMHSLYGVLTMPYVPVWVTSGVLVAYHYTLRFLAVEPRSNAVPFTTLSVCLEHLADPVFNGVGLAGFKSRANVFLLA